MNLNQIEYFISVANNLNFTKAAKEHYISQTAISQHIKNLEGTLGFKLLDRTKHSVSLTPAGKCFYNEAVLILERTKIAIDNASLIYSGYAGNLTIGFIEGHEKIFLPKLLSSFREKYSKINIRLVRGTMDFLYRNLQDGLIDVVFSFDFDIKKYSNISTKPITKYPLCAILYNNHPLSSRNSIMRSELKDEDLIFIDRSISPYGFDCMVSDCIASGFSPNFVYKADSIETVLLMVQSKLGISMLPKSDCNSYLNDLSFVTLENEYTNSIISWNNENTLPHLQLFLDFTSSVIINNII